MGNHHHLGVGDHVGRGDHHLGVDVDIVVVAIATYGSNALKYQYPFGDTYFSSINCQHASATVTLNKRLLKAINHMQH